MMHKIDEKKTIRLVALGTALARRFQLAARAAHLAFCDYDVRVHKIAGDSRFGEMYGLAPRENRPLTYHEWLNGIDHDDGKDGLCT